MYLGSGRGHSGEVPDGPAGGDLRHVHPDPAQPRAGRPLVQRLPLGVSSEDLHHFGYLTLVLSVIASQLSVWIERAKRTVLLQSS